jgi:hypothetical protein
MLFHICSKIATLTVFFFRRDIKNPNFITLQKVELASFLRWQYDHRFRIIGVLKLKISHAIMTSIGMVFIPNIMKICKIFHTLFGGINMLI